MNVRHRSPVYALLLGLALLSQCVLFVSRPSGIGHAAPLSQLVAVSGPMLQGSLPLQYNAHYLGLETTIRDGMINLTLAYDPQDDPNLRGFVNFFVLTEDGLRRYLNGDDPRSLSIATGTPLQFDPIGNKMGAAFRDSGRGQYTVIVFNNSEKAITYTLSAEGGVLMDDANQTLTAALAEAAATPTPTATPTLAPGVADPATFRLPGTIKARRVTGTLQRTGERHYLDMEPDIRDGQVIFNFSYDPQDVPELRGNMNFWILDEDALRRVIAGSRPEDLNLATGFPIPFNPFPNQLQASFNASGSRPYTVVVYNNTAISATYALAASGGVLLDQYVQTNEAKVSALEAAAINAETAGTTAPATAPIATPVATLTATNTAQITPNTTQLGAVGVERLAGELNQPYQHHYLGLSPTIRDGLIVITLDFDPKANQALVENFNFWVLDEDGLRRVIAGTPPIDVSIATGSVVRFGADRGKLRAVINASGRGRYTIVVFNNSNVPATYLLRANGGLLTDETAQTTLP